MAIVHEKYGNINAADQHFLLQKINTIPATMTTLDWLRFIRTQTHPEFTQVANQMTAIFKATNKDHEYAELNIQ